MKTEERTPAKDDPAFDIMRPGGKNSPYNKDGTPKPPAGRRDVKPPTGTGKSVENYEMGRPIPKDLKKRGPKGGDKKGLRYNPYGKGSTANPSNMSSTTGP